MTTRIITADEARALDPAKALEADLSPLSGLIAGHAKAGKTSCRAPYDMCEASGYSIKFKTLGVEDALKAAGYKVHSRSEDRQFVDVWIEISWGEEA